MLLKVFLKLIFARKNIKLILLIFLKKTQYQTQVSMIDVFFDLVFFISGKKEQVMHQWSKTNAQEILKRWADRGSGWV
jgi:hypothetical protein